MNYLNKKNRRCIITQKETEEILDSLNKEFKGCILTMYLQLDKKEEERFCKYVLYNRRQLLDEIQ